MAIKPTRHRASLILLLTIMFSTCHSQKTVTGFSPTSGVANVGTTITIVGTALSTADQVAVVDSTVSIASNSSNTPVSGCASLNNQGQAAFASNLFTVNEAGTEGSATVTLSTATTYSICVQLFPSTGWLSATEAGGSDIYTVSLPTVSGASMESGGNTISALMNQAFELTITGTGLIVDSAAINFRWTRGTGTCGNGTIVTGGDSRGLETANNAATSGTVSFTLTDSPQGSMSLCYSIAGGALLPVPATSASLRAPQISSWSLSPVAASSGGTVTISPNTLLTMSLSGADLLGEATQVACGEAEDAFSVCVKVATTCSDASDVSDIAGGDAVAPVMNSVGALTATFTFAIPAIDVTGMVCARSQGTSGAWAETTTARLLVPFPPVAVSLRIQPVTANSNLPLSLTITGRNFVEAGAASETKVKLAADCTLNTDSDTVGTVEGGSGRACSSLTSSGGRQLCVVQFEALSALATQQLQVCIQSGPSSPYTLGGTQIASVTGGGGSGYTAGGYVFDAAGTSCLGSSLALSLGLDDTGGITAITMTNSGEGYTCPPRFRGLTGTGATVTATLTTLTLAPVEVLAVQVPSLVGSNDQLSVSLLGKNLGFLGNGGIKVKVDLTCSASDSSSVFGGDARTLDIVGADGLHAEVFFQLSSTSSLNVSVCWSLASLSFTDASVSQFGSWVFLDPLAVTSFSPVIAYSQATTTLTLTGTGFATSGSTPLQVKLSTNCANETTDSADPSLAGSAAQAVTEVSSTSATVALTLATMQQLSGLQLCWRSTAFPYQAVSGLNLTVTPTSLSGFTPSAARAYVPFVLIVSGTNLGPDVYVKLATSCASSASDTDRTLPGSEGVLPTTSSSSASSYNFMVVALAVTDLHVCWRVGPGAYARVGTSAVTVTPIQVTNFIPKTGVSNTALSMTITGTGFIASPSNLLVRLKLSEDCSLYANSDQSTCGSFSGDCSTGGEGTLLANTADGGLSAVFVFNMGALATHPLDLCWSLDTSPPSYSSLGLGKMSMPPPTATAALITPAAPSVHQTITVSVQGTGLVSDGLMPAKIKLARECVGYEDAAPAYDIAGGEARLVSCTLNGGLTGSATFVLLSSTQPFKVCFAPGALGIAGLWAEVPNTAGSVSNPLLPPRVQSASLRVGATVVANVAFDVTLRGQGFGAAGDRIKVKVVPRTTGCGFPYVASGVAGCACDASGTPSRPGCVCSATTSDFEGVVAGGSAALVEPVSSTEGRVTLTLSDVGTFKLCWSVGDVSVSGSSYLEALQLTVSEPAATCVRPERISSAVVTTFYFNGQGLSRLDVVKFVDATLGCDSAAVQGGEERTLGSGNGVNPNGLAAIVEATIVNSASVDSLLACYRYFGSSQGFEDVGRVRIAIADPEFYRYSPGVIWTDQAFTVSVSGAGLASGQRIKVIRANQQCSNIFAIDASGGAEVAVSCATTSSDVTCTAPFTITQEAAPGQNNLTLCYSYVAGIFVHVGLIELRLPAVTTFEPTTVYAGAGTTLTLQGEGLRSTLAKRIKLVAMHAQCAGSSDTDNVVGGGEAAVLPVGADAGTVSLGLTLLAGTSGRSRVCYRAGSQAFAEIGQLVVASPLPTSAFPMLYAEPAPRSAVPAGVPFQLSVQGQGLQAPGLRVKIVPVIQVCLGSVNDLSDVVAGGGAQDLTAGVASFSGITEVGSVKVCIKGQGWPSYSEIPGSTFTVKEASATSILPQILILDQLTRIVVSGDGLTPALLTLISLRQDDCQVGRVPVGGDEVAMVDDDGGFGRRAYADFTISSSTTVTGTLRVCLSNSVAASRFMIGTITIADAAVRSSVYPAGIRTRVASTLVITGQGLDVANKIKIVDSLLSCGGMVGEASENTNIVPGGDSQHLAYASESHTEARTAPVTLTQSGSVRICFAAGTGATFTDLIQTSAAATPTQALLRVADYGPLITGPTLRNSRLTVVRGAPTVVTVYGTGVRINDVVLVTRGACPVDAASPSADVLAAITPVAGGQPVTIRAQAAATTPCGFSGFSVTLTIEETGSGLSMCYVPAGFGTAVPLQSHSIDVLLPSTRSLSPTSSFANRRQVYTLTGSGGYRVGDKVKLIRAYSVSDFAPAAPCGGLDDQSDVPGGSAYAVAAADIGATALRVTFNVSEAWVVVRMCYLPVGAASYQEAGSVHSLIEVRPPQIASVETQSVSARSTRRIPVTGSGLSVNDRFKIIPRSELCGGGSDALGAVEGGAGRRASVASSNGGRAEVEFTVATSAIGAATLCFKHEFSCEYKFAANITVRSPAIAAIGDARKDGNALNRVYPNRDAIMRLDGVGLTQTDVIRIVAPTSPCNPGDNYTLFGETSFFQTDTDRGSGLVVFNLRSPETSGKMCYRYCDSQCSAATLFDDTGITLPMVQPALSRVTPNSLLTEVRTTITVSGSSLTASDRVKVVFADQTCQGTDESAGILTGGNGRPLTPVEDCNRVRDRRVCSATVDFSLTFPGEAKLCYWYHGGPGYQEVAPGALSVCRGECVASTSSTSSSAISASSSSTTTSAAGSASRSSSPVLWLGVIAMLLAGMLQQV